MRTSFVIWQVRIYRLISDKSYERAMFEKACLKVWNRPRTQCMHLPSVRC